MSPNPLGFLKRVCIGLFFISTRVRKFGALSAFFVEGGDVGLEIKFPWEPQKHYFFVLGIQRSPQSFMILQSNDRQAYAESLHCMDLPGKVKICIIFLGGI